MSKREYNPTAQYVRIDNIPPHGKGVLKAKMQIIDALHLKPYRKGKGKHGHPYVTNEEARKLYVLFTDIDARPEASPLLDITDQDLVDELRRRGYQVKATKTTTIEL